MCQCGGGCGILAAVQAVENDAPRMKLVENLVYGGKVLRQKENGFFRNEGVCLLALIGSSIISFIVAKGMKTRWICRRKAKG